MSQGDDAAVIDSPELPPGGDNPDDEATRSPSRSRSSSASSSDPSRATSPASTVDNIGCIPEEPEEVESKDPEPDDQRLVDETYLQGSPPVGVDNYAVDKTDDPEFVPPQDEDALGEPDQSAGLSSSTSPARTDMDLLKAILHDDATGNDDVIPEETSSQVAQSDADNDDKEQQDEAVEEFNHDQGHVKEEANDEHRDEAAVAADLPAEGEANQEANDLPPDNQLDEFGTPDKPPTAVKRKKKLTLKKQKKKQHQQPLGPVAPWSRASINSFSRPTRQQQQQQPQPLASDRSTSLGAGSIGGTSRGSRAHSAISAKEMREKYRPVSNEEKMAQRLSEIDSLLARDYAHEARLAYQRSVAECRQAWQNYASTARIMGHVTDQTDEPPNQRSSRAHLFDNHEERAASIRRNHPLGGRVAPELDDPAAVSTESINNSDSHSVPQYPQPHRRKRLDNNHRPEENGSLQRDNNLETEQPVQEYDHPVEAVEQQEDQHQLHGYRIGAPQRMAGRFGSDHKLSESNNPDVRAWLREKNRAVRRQRRETRDAKRREMQARLDAQQLENDRRLEAEAAFQYWSKKKRQQQDHAKMDKSINNKPNGKRNANGQEPLPLADQEAAFAELENRPRQGGPRPPGSAKPVHNSVFKRSPAILGTAGASFSGRQVRMGVIGQHVDAEAPQTQQQLAIEQQPQVRLSFDEWSQRKSELLAVEQRRQREAERQRREAAAVADPQMSALVPQLARRRIRTATELKQRRTDTGLGLARPRTAVPALAPPPASSLTASATGGRRHSARARTSSLERREAAITSQLANPFVAPAEDAMLNRILGGGDN